MANPDGRVYYEHLTTGATQWDPPAGQDGDAGGAVIAVLSAGSVSGGVDGFFSWYYGPGGPTPQRREAVRMRVHRALQSSGSAMRKMVDKLASKRAKRTKQRLERISKHEREVGRAVADAAERQKQRASRGGKEVARRLAAVSEARRVRLTRGERAWGEHGKWVNDVLLVSGSLATSEQDNEEEEMARAEEEELEGMLHPEEIKEEDPKDDEKGDEELDIEKRRHGRRVLRVPYWK